MAFPDELQKEMQDRFSKPLADELNRLHEKVFGKPKPPPDDDDAEKSE